MPSPHVSAYGANSVTDSTLTVTADAYAGQKLILDRAAGITATLPAASGSGNSYEFFVATTVTSNSHIIKVANASDTMVGVGTLLADAGDTVVAFAAAGTSDTLTMNGTTQGGIAGAYARLTDIKANLWHVEYYSDASGIEVTPFSATV